MSGLHDLLYQLSSSLQSDIIKTKQLPLSRTAALFAYVSQNKKGVREIQRYRHIFCGRGLAFPRSMVIV